MGTKDRTEAIEKLKNSIKNKKANLATAAGVVSTAMPEVVMPAIRSALEGELDFSQSYKSREGDEVVNTFFSKKGELYCLVATAYVAGQNSYVVFAVYSEENKTKNMAYATNKLREVKKKLKESDLEMGFRVEWVTIEVVDSILYKSRIPYLANVAVIKDSIVVERPSPVVFGPDRFEEFNERIEAFEEKTRKELAEAEEKLTDTEVITTTTSEGDGLTIMDQSHIDAVIREINHCLGSSRLHWKEPGSDKNIVVGLKDPPDEKIQPAILQHFKDAGWKDAQWTGNKWGPYPYADYFIILVPN